MIITVYFVRILLKKQYAFLYWNMQNALCAFFRFQFLSCSEKYIGFPKQFYDSLNVNNKITRLPYGYNILQCASRNTLHSGTSLKLQSQSDIKQHPTVMPNITPRNIFYALWCFCQPNTVKNCRNIVTSILNCLKSQKRAIIRKVDTACKKTYVKFQVQ